MPTFDIAIIGSGSGNALVTSKLRGRRIAIIEEGVFGGTCLNVGCIPTKMYVYAADLAEAVRNAGRLGVDATLQGARWSDIRDRIFHRIDPISASGRAYRQRGPHTALFEAHARFTGPHELALSTGERIDAEQIVIATGSRPLVPPLVADSGVPYLTSSTILRLEQLPARLAILGGGYVSAEFAHIASALGSQVTIVSRSAPLLRQLDRDIAVRFTQLAQQRWDVRLGAEPAAVKGDAGTVRLDLTDGGVVEADALLVATGRRPNSDDLGVEAAGVEVHEDGRVRVDAYQRTTADGVWALGDVCSPHQLKHVSNHEARVVAHNLAHPDDLVESDHRYVPAAVFTRPQIASVGLTQDQARAAGLDHTSALLGYGHTAYGWAMEDTSSLCKLVAERGSGRLLGAHLIGEQASTLIQPLIQALSFGQTVRDVARGQYWIHPALTEVVENALLALELD